MKPFLRQVAEAYLANERENMMDYCFVFPNKRSGVFFRHYLTTGSAGMPLILPAISTISEMTASLTPYALAPRLDRLFTLYNEYSRLSGDIADFDRFMFWGEMILNDFNDVDLYLVDPSRLFVNLKRYREISSSFLTPEQEEILERYWGAQFERQSPEEFWKHLHNGTSTPLEGKFLKLWEVLDPLYHNFRDALLARGLATEGMMAREAVGRLRSLTNDRLPFRRYIFVGSNVLSLAELRICSNLQVRGMADFYWDIASPAMLTEGNRASRFMMRNARCFPSMYRLEDDGAEPSGFPEIHVTGIPSAIGEAKAAGDQLSRWVSEGAISAPDNAINTAVVLPDENLFVPMVHSVPQEITSLNVTMGFPMRATSFASFISSVVSLQLRAQCSRDEWSFFFDDVRTLTAHPLLRRVDGEGCAVLTKLVTDRRLYLVPQELVAQETPSLSFVFSAVSDSNSVDEVYGYFHSLLSSLLASVASRKESEEDADIDDSQESVPDDVEEYFIRSYLDALDELKGAIDRSGVTMREMTFIQLLQRAISSTVVNFTGEPLKGLQMMGVLETRALDFENLIILSMNERMFPRRLYTRSFIPDSLRKSYGMSTSDFQESIFAYSFYRLISRASRVRLLYDARNISGKNSEMSRYIAQLLYLYPESKVHHDMLTYNVSPGGETELSIPKTPEIMAKLMEFTPGGGTRTLSASSINDYINCPLSFYLKRMCRLDLDEEVIDYMDSGTYGSILHAVVERVYKEFKGEADEVKITSDMLDSVINSAAYLDRIITEIINTGFNKLPEGSTRALVGEAKVLGVIIKHFVKLMFRDEKRITPFDFIAAEYPVRRVMRINDSLSINIQQIIDRIDRVYPEGHYGTPGAGTVRIVDYKTGSDKTSFTSVDQLFDNTVADRRKAIMQLMFYCNAYAEETGYNGPVKPVIYQLKTLSTLGLAPISMNRAPLEDYREINEEFMAGFRRVVEEIFDPKVPFTQAPDDHSCAFCSFKPICRRNN